MFNEINISGILMGLPRMEHSKRGVLSGRHRILLTPTEHQSILFISSIVSVMLMIICGAEFVETELEIEGEIG